SDCDDELSVVLDMTIDGDRAIYDFSRSDAQAKGAINGTMSVSASAAIATTKAVFPHIPMNQGVFNAIELVMPLGSIVNAEYPRPVGGAGATVFPAVYNAVLGCFMQVRPDRAMAGTCGLVSLVFGGHDPRPGVDDEFVAYLWFEGGWGA